MASCRPVIQEMMGQDHPTGKIHVLQEKDMNKMDKYITHLKNLVTGPIDCLLYTPRDIQFWTRRYWWMLWLSHNRKLNDGNDQKMMLQSIIGKHCIM